MIAQNAGITPAQPASAFAAGGLAAPPPVPEGEAVPPPGALPEEVADDVDAKLSRGEYVIPADVVRFMGLEQIEKIIGKAKQGLMAMQEQGRIQDAPPPEASASPAGAAVDPAATPVAPAPQGAPVAPPGGPPGFAAGGMVGMGDLYSNTYNQYQQQAGNAAPSIETYVDENGRLAYRYIDAKGRPVGQPKVRAPGFAGGEAGTGNAAPATTPPLTNPGTISPVAPGLHGGNPGGGDGDGSNGGLGNTESSDPRDTPGNYTGSFGDFLSDVEAGVSVVSGGLPGMVAGAYGLGTTGKPMSVDQALNHAFGIGMPNLGIQDWVADQVDLATGHAQRSTDPNYTGKAPETIMADGTRIKWNQPVAPLNDPSSKDAAPGGYTDDMGGHYNADGTYTDAKGKDSAVGPKSAVDNYTRDKQALPDAVAARTGAASSGLGGTNYSGPSGMPNSISDPGAMSSADLRDSYTNSLGAAPSSAIDPGSLVDRAINAVSGLARHNWSGGGRDSSYGMGGTNYGGPSGMANSIGDRGAMSASDLKESWSNSQNTSGLGGYNGGWGGGYTSDSPGTAGGGGGEDGNNGAGSW